MPSKWTPRWSKSKEHSTTAGPSTLQQSTTQADGPASIAANSNSGSTSIGKGQNYGIRVLHDGGTEACVDIVFVHGLTGNAYDTWLHKETGVHWPSDLLKQDLPDTRILSYGYDADIVNFWNPASNSQLSNHAERLVGDLVREREDTNTENRKILFVAHSLGGLVTESALSHSQDAPESHLRQVARWTAGIAFLGVPHSGSHLGSLAETVAGKVNFFRSANKGLVGVLEPNSEMLHDVETKFQKILRLRKNAESEIAIVCFFEELGVGLIGEV